MLTKIETETQTQPTAEPLPDPIDQALALVSMLSKSEQIKQQPRGLAYKGDNDNADDRTLVLAGVGLAIATHLRRIADALEARNA